MKKKIKCGNNIVKAERTYNSREQLHSIKAEIKKKILNAKKLKKKNNKY